MNYPILTRIPLERARERIFGSKARVEAELGKETLGFAYHGLEDNYNEDIQRMAEEAGCGVAFTLLNGPQLAIRSEASAICHSQNIHLTPTYTSFICSFSELG